MPHWLELPYLALSSRFDARFELSQALFYPELVRMGSARKSPVPILVESLQKHFAELPALRLHGRYPPVRWEVRPFRLELAPARASVLWNEPWTLELWALCYPPVPGVAPWEAAFFPSLGIEVIVTDPAELERAVLTQVRGELLRRGALNDLGQLLQLARWGELRADSGVMTVARKTLKEQLGTRPAEEDWLGKLATALLDLPASAAGYEHHLQRVAEMLCEGGRSVLLVGPSGVGKTAAFHELARRKRGYALAATPFFETTGARLIAGEQGFGSWQERCLALLRQWAARKAIVHLGSLVELLEVGRHSTQPAGMAGFLRASLARGQVQAVAECTEEQLSYLERELPQLLEAFTIYRFEKPHRERTREILATRFRSLPAETRDTALELRERFASHSAGPGWEVRLLRSVPKDASPIQVLERFSAQSGIPLRFLDGGAPLPHEEVSRWLNARVRGQSDAVERVVDRVLAFKAGLNRPGRPLASMLLMGPTGVGKTELARALAEYVFQDRSRLTRLDMSEYSDPLAVRRLVGWAGSSESGVLIRMVRELPFQVVLFDEVEKADPDFFDLLLQILGEGRLSDARGNLADFSNCLILMTTNLGAEAMARGSVGFRDQPPQQGYLEAVRSAFRPELLNRIDEVVPFAGLSAETIEVLTEIEIERIQRSPGLRRRNPTWHVTPQAVPALAAQGYDPRYGARPLKRAIEKLLLGPLAAQLNGHSEEAPLQILVGAIDGVVEAFVRPLSDPTAAEQDARRRRNLGDQITLLRRRAAQFGRGPLVSELRNQRVRHQRRNQGQPWPEQSLLDATEALDAEIETLEEDALLSLEQLVPFDEEGLRRRCDELLNRLNASMVRLFCRSFEPRNEVTVAFYSDHHASLRMLAEEYIRIARDRGLAVELQSLQVRRGEVPPPSSDDPQPQFDRRAKELDWWIAGFPGSALGVLLHFSGTDAHPLFHLEGGVHVFQRLEGERSVLVEVSRAPLTSGHEEHPFRSPAYLPPDDLHRRGTLAQLMRSAQTCRTYDLPRGKCTDALITRPHNCTRGTELTLLNVLDTRLLRVAEEAALAT